MSLAHYEIMSHSNGFIAALDQSGGSTPGALEAYGITPGTYSNSQMPDLIHEMRTRIITDYAFDERILATILFEETVDREIEGLPTAQYLWEQKGIVPIMKVDKGLAGDAKDAVQLMNDIPRLMFALQKARDNGVYGTKMRSVIRGLDPTGIERVVDQQFGVAERILSEGLVPIIEPEVSIKAVNREGIESELRSQLIARLASVGGEVILKLTLPEVPDFYKELTDHPKVIRVAALSGGFVRKAACQMLAKNHGVIASFSRALTEGLNANQTSGEFTATLDESIGEIYEASVNKSSSSCCGGHCHCS